MNAYKLKIDRDKKPNEFIVIANNLCRVEKLYRDANKFSNIISIDILETDILFDKEEFLSEFGRNLSDNSSESIPFNH